LPLVDSEDSDGALVLTQWGVLIHDQQIGHAMRVLGWLGMLTTVAWFAWRIWRNAKAKDSLF
jgi:hypothetical protein